MHVLIIPSWYPSSAAEASGSFFRDQAISIKRHFPSWRVGIVYPELRSILHFRKLFSTEAGIQHRIDEGVLTTRSFGIYGLPRQKTQFLNTFLKAGLNLFERYISTEGRPSIIHAHCAMPAGVLAKTINEIYGIPYLISEHSSLFNSNGYSNSEIKLIEDAYLHAAKLFAVSDAFVEEMKTEFPRSGSKWKTLTNSVSNAFRPYKNIFPPDPSAEFVFVYVGYLRPAKRVDLILRALKKVTYLHPRTKLKIVGDGDTRAELLSLANDLGIANSVEFLGQRARTEIPTLIAQCHALLLASDHETFGMVVVEALAIGKPVVSTSCGGPSSIIQNDRNGYLVPCNDESAFASRMLQLIDHYADFNCDTIAKDCTSKYGEEQIASKTAIEYLEVAAAHVN